MSKFSSILQQKFRKKEKPKTTALVEKKSERELSNIFGKWELEEQERDALSVLLQKYAPDEQQPDVDQDLSQLVTITSEIKAINNQAAILQGERIKRAQQILKKYRDGAFTAWLLTTYGNRQTPYNFLQYYEFYSKMPQTLHSQINSMPRQAIYTLASREGVLSKKEEIVRNYNGETKQQLITLIRSEFPLKEKDKRRENIGENTIKGLKQLIVQFKQTSVKLTTTQKETLKELLDQFASSVDICEGEEERLDKQVLK
ncbi:MAG: CT583 family protein [Chlamydiales bacterium]